MYLYFKSQVLLCYWNSLMSPWKLDSSQRWKEDVSAAGNIFTHLFGQKRCFFLPILNIRFWKFYIKIMQNFIQKYTPKVENFTKKQNKLWNIRIISTQLFKDINKQTTFGKAITTGKMWVCKCSTYCFPLLFM